VSPLLTQLATLCRDHPTRTKWLFAPSHNEGHALTERLARTGTPWANVRVTTPRDVAMAMAAPALVARGIDPAPDGLGPALVMRLLLDLPAKTPSYFRFLSDQPGMADALWRTIQELRLAGGAADALQSAAFAVRAKHAELQALVRAYEHYLAVHRLADRADVYGAALEHLDACPVGPDDLRLELPGTVWTPLERRLLDALPGTLLPSHTLQVAGLEPSPTFRARGARTTTVAPAPRSDAERLAFLMEPVASPPPCRDGTLALFRAAGREAEVEEVLRRILGGGRRLDGVEIACASPEYASLLWDKTQKLGLPVTLAAGLPASCTRPARGLLAFLSWAADRFPAGALRRLLQSGDVKLGFEDGGPSAGQAARILARSAATWERHTYAPALAALADELELRAADAEEDATARAANEERAAHARRLTEAVQGMLDLVPEPSADGLMPLSRLVDGCRRFLGTHAVVTGELDAAACTVVDRTLADLLVLGDLALPLGDAVRLVRDRIAGITVGGSRACAGHLHVSPLSAAGHAGRPFTFAIGLEESGVFPAALEDPVLLDDERIGLREKAGLDLPTSGDRVSDALHTIVARLAALGGHVCLSYSCRDVREGRVRFPSWLLLQAHRLLTGKPEATYDALSTALGDPVTAVPASPDQAQDDCRWWLAALDGTGRAAVASVEAAFPALERGRIAEAARDAADFTVYDGLVTAASRLDPRVSGTPVSPTNLEKLATCPFRFFLERGLGLTPLDDVAPEPGRWLDPATRGKLLHELFATLLRELRARDEVLDPARHGARARALAAERLETLRARIPPPFQHVYEREASAILRDIDHFLRGEANDPERRPVGFEVAFGLGTTDDEPLGQADPVTIDLGDGLRFALRGRIDRIDRLRDGTYDVVDYKTGRFFLPGGVEKAHFAGGRQLQHALYALAAERLLRRIDAGARVASGSYYFPSERGGGQRARREVAPLSKLAPLVGDLLGVIASGAFVHTTDDSDCSYCDFQLACGRSAVERAKSKIDNADNAVLAAFKSLRTHG
jgi:ATP-dependent helicase/nuclease subunit B